MTRSRAFIDWLVGVECCHVVCLKEDPSWNQDGDVQRGSAYADVCGKVQSRAFTTASRSDAPGVRNPHHHPIFHEARERMPASSAAAHCRQISSRVWCDFKRQTMRAMGHAMISSVCGMGSTRKHARNGFDHPVMIPPSLAPPSPPLSDPKPKPGDLLPAAAPLLPLPSLLALGGFRRPNEPC